MIRTLCVILDLKKEEIKEIYRHRIEELENAIDRLALKKEYLKKDKEKVIHQIFLKKTKEETRKENWLQLASEIRKIPILKHFHDDEIFALSGIIKTVNLKPESFLFKEGDTGFDIFILKKGEVSLQKETPFGPQLLLSVMVGDMFGEMNYIDRTSRTADAYIPRETEIYITFCKS